jgi:hypothetical protein
MSFDTDFLIRKAPLLLSAVWVGAAASIAFL